MYLAYVSWTTGDILDLEFSELIKPKGFGYRFGFQGQETDLERISFKYRIYNSRIGRFTSVDPLQKTYPHISPYVFCENRTIDGVDFEGLEYVTRRHIESGTGVVVATSDLIFYQMSDKEILAHGGTIADWYNAASYGPEGKGVKHEFYDASGNLLRTAWGNKRTSLNNYKYHGLYSGPGCISKYGVQEIGGYDFGWEPIDASDATAKRHDLAYAIAAPNDYQGYVEDTRTLAADNAMITEVNTLLNSDENFATETSISLKAQKTMIGLLAEYKTWKIGRILELDENANLSDPNVIKRVSISTPADYERFIRDTTTGSNKVSRAISKKTQRAKAALILESKSG